VATVAAKRPGAIRSATGAADDGVRDVLHFAASTSPYSASEQHRQLRKRDL